MTISLAFQTLKVTRIPKWQLIFVVDQLNDILMSFFNLPTYLNVFLTLLPLAFTWIISDYLDIPLSSDWQILGCRLMSIPIRLIRRGNQI